MNEIALHYATLVAHQAGRDPRTVGRPPYRARVELPVVELHQARVPFARFPRRDRAAHRVGLQGAGLAVRDEGAGDVDATATTHLDRRAAVHARAIAYVHAYELELAAVGDVEEPRLVLPVENHVVVLVADQDEVHAVHADRRVHQVRTSEKPDLDAREARDARDGVPQLRRRRDLGRQRRRARRRRRGGGGGGDGRGGGGGDGGGGGGGGDDDDGVSSHAATGMDPQVAVVGQLPVSPRHAVQPSLQQSQTPVMSAGRSAIAASTQDFIAATRRGSRASSRSSHIQTG